MLLLMGISISINAQSDSINDQFIGKTYLSFNVGKLFGFPPAIQFGVEQKITDRLYTELELAYLFFPEELYADPRYGYKIEQSFMFVLGPKIRLGPKFHFKSVNIERSEFVFENNLTFQRLHDFTIKRRFYGILCELAIGENIGNNKRFRWEFNTSIGANVLSVKHENYPEQDFVNQRFITLFPDEKNYLFLIFQYGFKFKYAIR